jgi:hypothetical protein
MKITLIIFSCIFFIAINLSSGTTVPSHIKKHSEHENTQVVHTKNSEHAEDHHKQVKKTKSSKADVEIANKGQHGLISHKVEDVEKAGKKHNNHAKDSHKSHKKAAGHHEHSAKYADGKKQKKTGFSKGFQDKYHKYEHKKHDRFYDNGKKSGSYKMFGQKDSKYGKHADSKVEHKNKMSLKSLDHHKKSGKSSAGHKKSESAGHKYAKGKSTHYDKHDKWAKKSQRPESKKKYKYAQVHH